MGLFIAAFLAGGFSVLAPCVLPLLPALLVPSTRVDDKSRRSAWWLLAGLGGSIILFSILLKSTTALLNIPSSVWSTVSGVIVLLFGVSLAWPKSWEWLMLRTGLALSAQKQSAGASQKRGRIGDILFGASLGPIFSVCSPTYALIVAVILPADPLSGLLYLLVYVLGLVLMMGLVAVLGKKLITRLKWGVNPNGVFRRLVGAVLVVFGLMIITGLDKQLSAWLVGQGWFDWQVYIENMLAK